MGAGASFVEDDSDYDDVDAAMLLGGRYIDDAGPRARRMQPYGGESDGNSAVAAMHALMAMGGRGGFGVSDDSFPPDQYTQQHVQDLGGGHIRIIHRSVHRIGRGGELSPTDGPIGAEIGEGALATSPASRGPRFLGAAASSSASSVATTSYAPSLGSRRTSAGGPSILPRYACHQCHRTFILREVIYFLLSGRIAFLIIWFFARAPVYFAHTATATLWRKLSTVLSPPLAVVEVAQPGATDTGRLRSRRH